MTEHDVFSKGILSQVGEYVQRFIDIPKIESNQEEHLLYNTSIIPWPGFMKEGNFLEQSNEVAYII